MSPFVRSLICLFAAFAPAANAEKIAITFDDLPFNGRIQEGSGALGVIQRTVAILRERRAPLVFGFINAQRLESNPDGVAALQFWIGAGQRVGNHSYSHTNLNAVDIDEYGRDILRNEPVLMLLSPAAEWRWFRYPYLREGDTLDKRSGVRAFLSQHRYRIAQTTIDYEDYLWNTPFSRCAQRGETKAITRLHATYVKAMNEAIDSARVSAQAAFGREIDHVLVLHLGAFTPDILPTVLDTLARRGFELATLEEVQTDPAYQSDPKYVGSRGGTLLQQHVIARKLPLGTWPTLPRAALEGMCRS